MNRYYSGYLIAWIALYFFLQVIYISPDSLCAEETPPTNDSSSPINSFTTATDSTSTGSNEKVFGTVVIQIDDIFSPPENSLYETVNSLKINTKQYIIEQELLFESGQAYDRFLVTESERVLRRLRYLREAEIKEEHVGNVVNIVVVVQDTWTVIPQVSYSSGDGRSRRSVGLSEGNLFGMGKRIEALYEEDQNADTFQIAYDDRRIMGSKYQGQVAAGDGSEGSFFFYDVGDPFRSLVQEDAWLHSATLNDGIGRLFAGGDERFVYREKREEFDIDYAFTIGDQEVAINRFSFGFQYNSSRFDEATLDDLDDIGVDPEDLPEDGGVLADNRRFVGPTIGFEQIEKDFIKVKYIDRFTRYEDFNLGERFGSSVMLAPEALGAREDTFLWNALFGNGYRLSKDSFMRWEFSAQSRLNKDGADNSIASVEGQFYRRIGQFNWHGIDLGNHTIATRVILDYADDLDNDEEFLVGADNFLRGYDARTFTGDKRFAINFEDRVHIAENIYDLVHLGFAFFGEAGGATTRTLGNLFEDELYADVGVGLRLAFPKSNGERVLRIDMAFPLREGPDGSDRFELRVIFSGGQLFSSRLPSERAAANRVGVDLGF